MISTGLRGRQTLPAKVTSLVNHELSSPLATALLYIGIAEGHCAAGPVGPARSALGIARAEIQRLKQLVDRVTELERHGHAIVRPALVDLGAVVADAVNRSIAAEAGARSNVTVKCQSGAVSWWDEVAISQIVVNLLSNAFKFGQGRPVRIELRQAAPNALLTVHDDGVGVAASERDRIFERHVCAPPDQGGGLGLGLWLVRELAQAHGGSAFVDRSGGRGATFVVSLRAQMPTSAHATPLLIGERRESRRTRRAAAALLSEAAAR